MRFLVFTMLAACMLTPTVSQAALTWSPCETVTAVADYLAYSNNVWITVTPAISGCTVNANGTGWISFAENQEGVTNTTISSILAVALSAYSSGHQVAIYYDTATAPTCYSAIIAVGGYYGECP